jgi:protein-tyrosine phosphatase
VSALLLAALLALPAGAQEGAAPLSRAAADAKALAAAGPGSGTINTRLDPDDDSGFDAEPAAALGNLRAVEPGFFRSAQPNKQGYALLNKMGVKTILNLKDKASAERERLAVKKYGMSVESVAMSGFSTPSFREMDRALAVLKTAPRPLLVHCAHGKDRTGFVVASYRVVEEKRSVEDAVSEAKDAGCCFVMFKDLAAFLREYASYRRGLATEK